MPDPFLGVGPGDAQRIQRFVRRSEREPRGRQVSRSAYPVIMPDPIVPAEMQPCCNGACDPWRSITGTAISGCSACPFGPLEWILSHHPMTGIDTGCCGLAAEVNRLKNEGASGCVWTSDVFDCYSAVSGQAQWVLTVSTTRSTLILDLGGGNRVCYEKWGPWCGESTNQMNLCCGPRACNNYPPFVCLVPVQPPFPPISHPCGEPSIESLPGLLWLTLEAINCECSGFPKTLPLISPPTGGWYKCWTNSKACTGLPTDNLLCANLTCDNRDNPPDHDRVFVLFVHRNGAGDPNFRGSEVDHYLGFRRHPGWTADPFHLVFEDLPAHYSPLPGGTDDDSLNDKDGRGSDFVCKNGTGIIFRATISE